MPDLGELIRDYQRKFGPLLDQALGIQRDRVTTAPTPGAAPASRWETPGATPSATAQPGLPNYVNQGAASGNPDAEGTMTTTVPFAVADPTEGQFTPPHTGTNLTELQRADNNRALAKWYLDRATAAQAKVSPENAAGLVAADTAIRGYQSALQAAENAYTAEANREEGKKKPHQIQKQEKHPNGGTYLVTYDVDAQGNEKWNGQKPQELFPPSEQTGLQLETAQFNLKKAQSDFAEATSPEAKREAQLKLDLAEFNLQQARKKSGQEDRPSILSGVPETQEWILSRDPTTGAVTRERNPAYRAPISQIIQPGTGKTITTRDPTTGAITTEPNPAWTPEMEEAQQLELGNLRRGQLPQNPLAAYTQEAQRLQGEAQRELDRLRDLQRTGAITATDADTQFKSYLAARVTPQLAGLKTQAEEAQRLERTQIEERNRLEQIRADTANRAREQVGYQAGETARSQIMQIAPDVRSDRFLQGYGNMVGNMAARANAPSAEAANRLAPAPTLSGDDFKASDYAAVIPNLDQAARDATARALAGISPTAARLANLPTVNMPTGPDLQGMLAQLPYQGALRQPPPGLQPLPGMEAVDQLPFGRPGWARTTYPGVGGGAGGYQDWQIPPFGG